jgi:hypothetical protein
MGSACASGVPPLSAEGQSGLHMWQSVAGFCVSLFHSLGGLKGETASSAGLKPCHNLCHKPRCNGLGTALVRNPRRRSALVFRSRGRFEAKGPARARHVRICSDAANEP